MHTHVHVVVVYHVTIAASGRLKKFWSMAIDCILRNEGSSYQKPYRPGYFVRTTQISPQPGHDHEYCSLSTHEVIFFIKVRTKT